MRQAWEAVHLAYRCPYPIDIGLVLQDLSLAESVPVCRLLYPVDIVCHHLLVGDLRNRAHRRMGVPLIEGPSSKNNSISLLLSKVNLSL
jgi:hypothetical protein